MPVMASPADVADVRWLLPTQGDGRYGAWKLTGVISIWARLDRAGRGRPWILASCCRPGALRRFLRLRLCHGAADPKAATPGRGSPRAVRTIDDHADGGDTRPPVGRPVLINVVADGDPAEMRGHGV